MKRRKPRLKRRDSSKRLLRSKSPFSYQSFIDLWQITFFGGISLVIISSLMNTGWSQISISDAQIKGNQIFNTKEIIKASGIDFPKPLLEIIPKRVEGNLKSNLSLKAASINRQILPKALIIEVLEREPIAYAHRLGDKGVEIGLIDKYAVWIPLPSVKSDTPKIDIQVYGWENRNRNLISFILHHQNQLGSPLKEISLSSLGEIRLSTEDFKSINLGSNPNQLKDQLLILAHLSKNLPTRLLKKNKTTIDLTDPSKPELQTGLH